MFVDSVSDVSDRRIYFLRSEFSSVVVIFFVTDESLEFLLRVILPFLVEEAAGAGEPFIRRYTCFCRVRDNYKS